MRIYKFQIMATTLSAFVLTSCGGSGASSPAPIATTPPPTSNAAPTVNAGEDKAATAGATVSLSATASDPDGDSLTYAWVQIDGTPVTLSDAASTEANFAAPNIDASEKITLEFTASDPSGASASDQVIVQINPTAQSSKCDPSDVPDSLRDAPYRLDFFYQKYCDVDGIPVLGSTMVRERAMVEAVDKASNMTRNLDPSVLQAMTDNNTRIAIMAESEVTTDIPEHSDLNTAFPDTDWDTRARGLGATNARPASSAGEENLLCLNTDIYSGEDIFVHEFAHTIHIMGMNNIDNSFETELGRIYDAAMAAGLWADTYAATNPAEYFAEGVQSFYNVNQSPQAGIHNDIDTRAELKSYDPDLHDLIESYLNPDYQPSCPSD